MVNHEPLLINTAGSWRYRPEAVTRIPNLFLAADYVRTNTDIATMESANEAARRAVNGILDAAGAGATRGAGSGTWTSRPSSSRCRRSIAVASNAASRTSSPRPQPSGAGCPEGPASARSGPPAAAGEAGCARRVLE